MQSPAIQNQAAVTDRVLTFLQSDFRPKDAADFQKELGELDKAVKEAIWQLIRWNEIEFTKDWKVQAICRVAET